MNRSFYFFTLILFALVVVSLSGPLQAQPIEENSLMTMNSALDKNAMAGMTLGSLGIASDRFKEVFGNPSLVTGIEASYLRSFKNHLFCFSFELRAISKSGHSTITNRNTFFSMTPFTLSAKYLLSRRDFNPYLGAGFDLFFYKEKSHLSLVSGMAPGIHMEGGFYYKPPFFEFIKIRAFLRISRAVAKENYIKVNLGGWEFGLGIFYCFNV